MLSCREATRLLSAAQEHRLPLGRRLSLRLHLMMCRACRNFGQHLHVLRGLARGFAAGADQQARRDRQPGDGDPRSGT